MRPLAVGAGRWLPERPDRVADGVHGQADLLAERREVEEEALAAQHAVGAGEDRRARVDGAAAGRVLAEERAREGHARLSPRGHVRALGADAVQRARVVRERREERGELLRGGVAIGRREIQADGLEAEVGAADGERGPDVLARLGAAVATDERAADGTLEVAAVAWLDIEMVRRPRGS